MFERPRSGERAVLVRLGLGAHVDPEDVQEFTQLAVSAGAQPVATILGRRERPDPRFFMGSGKADEVRDVAASNEADVILVDHALSPSQERNLEQHTGRRVLDRNTLILDIFAQRARSHEGKLEVELAQLKHIASRLVRGWTHLERQKGGIGMRGPGETQLETDRRMINQKISRLKEDLERILDHEFAAFVEWLGQLREQAKANEPDAEKRRYLVEEGEDGRLVVIPPGHIGIESAKGRVVPRPR